MRTIHRAFLLAAFTFVFCGVPTVLAGTHHLIRFIRPGQLSGYALETMQFSPDGSILAVATTDGVVSFISPASGEKVGSHKHAPFSISFSKDGTRLLMIGRRSTELLDMQVGIPVDIVDSKRNDTGVIGISLNLKDGKLLISKIRSGSPAEKSGSISVGDELVAVAPGKAGDYRKVVGFSVNDTLEALRGRPGEYVRLKTVPKGTIEDNEVLIRRAALRTTAAGSEIVPFEESTVNDNVAWCISDGSQAFYGAKDGVMASSFRLEEIANNRGSHAISPDNKQCAFLGRRLKPNDKEFAIEIVDIGTRERIAFIRNIESRNAGTLGPVSAFWGFHYSPDGKYLLVGTWSGIQVVSIEEGKEIHQIDTSEEAKRFAKAGEKLTKSGRIAEFSLSSQNLLAVGIGSSVRLFDFGTGKYLHTLPKRDEDDKVITGIEFSPEGKWLAYYNNDRLHLVDVEEFNPKPKEEDQAAATDEIPSTLESAAP
ncbi:MAG: PDZ domain-containing protein [Planctomycetales bacterium]|nr:PDZ domain-containing protein [Planctomycetales bacterium]